MRLSYESPFWHFPSAHMQICCPVKPQLTADQRLITRRHARSAGKVASKQIYTLLIEPPATCNWTSIQGLSQQCGENGHRAAVCALRSAQRAMKKCVRRVRHQDEGASILNGFVSCLPSAHSDCSNNLLRHHVPCNSPLKGPWWAFGEALCDAIENIYDHFFT